ncbi:MAG: glycerate kinase [Kiritimatiellae bacterium]|nr:glycerate kinase [Kiritimatiellia bacterium]
MKVTIAVDSFKGSMTSIEAGNAIKKGIIGATNNQAIVNVIPVADGGEGTIEALTFGKQCETHKIPVTGPLGNKIFASYIITNAHTAIIEMAEAAGITLVPKEQRNPMLTTTFGVGELIKDALNKNCRKFIIGIGGSATNDCGIGMLQALGFKINDEHGTPVPFGANGVRLAAAIENSPLASIIKECEFTIACDVDNPLTGEKGCSKIFAPQKGATPEMVEQMDEWMNCFAEKLEKYVQNRDSSITSNRYTPGAGAAGGIGFAFLMMLNGKLMSGAQIVIRETKLEEHISQSDIIIVGEGKLDSQSTMGKIPVTIAKLAKKHGKKVIAYAGIIEDKQAIGESKIFDGAYEINREGMPLDVAMIKENSVANLSRTVENTFSNY